MGRGWICIRWQQHLRNIGKWGSREGQLCWGYGQAAIYVCLNMYLCQVVISDIWHRYKTSRSPRSCRDGEVMEGAFLGRGNSMYKGPEVRMCWFVWRSSRKLCANRRWGQRPGVFEEVKGQEAEQGRSHRSFGQSEELLLCNLSELEFWSEAWHHLDAGGKPTFHRERPEKMKKGS